MFNIFSSEREESFQEILTDIKKKAKLRDGLITKNESLEEKIIKNSGSIFIESWIKQMGDYNMVIKNIESDLKEDYEKLTDAELKKLPDYLLNLRRFL